MRYLKRFNESFTSTFNEWLVEKGYVTEESQIEYELSANEVDELYQIWTDETGGTGSGLF